MPCGRWELGVHRVVGENHMVLGTGIGLVQQPVFVSWLPMKAVSTTEKIPEVSKAFSSFFQDPILPSMIIYFFERKAVDLWVNRWIASDINKIINEAEIQISHIPN
jgi:hypothetical protein